MVQATPSPQVSSLSGHSTHPAKIAYSVAMPEPQNHLFEVTLEVHNWRSPTLDLKMPVWTPGSYLVREYARHVQDFSVKATAQDSNLPWQKRSKNHWQIATQGCSEITVYYRVYANELTVRTNHLDESHGYFNGAALFFFIEGCQHEPSTLTIDPPFDDWQISTTLPRVAGSSNTFLVENFDVLVDSPVEVGRHQSIEFECEKKKHYFVVWGEGNIDLPRLARDTQKVIQTEAKIYGGLPYDEYHFLLHLSGSGYGGLEHKNSCSLNYPRFGFQASDQYHRFIQLVSHEFFHLWNVKRIRPQALEQFDYEQENYTPSLWFCEGVTSYYDLLIPLRAGIYNQKVFLESLSKDITRYLTTPGRLVQPLAESSFDAWIKLYRQDANSNNNQISYYLKGALVSLMLDLLIRKKHQNQRSLDDVMRRMWQDFGREEIGFSPTQLQQVFESVADCKLDDFFQRYLHTTEPLPLEEYLEPFGLTIKPIYDQPKIPYLGFTVQDDNNQTIIRRVDSGSPAHLAGINAEDQLLAIAQYRVTAEQLNNRLQSYQAGDTISITIFRQDQLKTLTVTLVEAQPSSYKVVKISKASAQQQHNLQGWLS